MNKRHTLRLSALMPARRRHRRRGRYLFTPSHVMSYHIDHQRSTIRLCSIQPLDALSTPSVLCPAPSLHTYLLHLTCSTEPALNSIELLIILPPNTETDTPLTSFCPLYLRIRYLLSIMRHPSPTTCCSLPYHITSPRPQYTEIADTQLRIPRYPRSSSHVVKIRVRLAPHPMTPTPTHAPPASHSSPPTIRAPCFMFHVRT